MKENVQITIKGTQHDLSAETTEVTYAGKYRCIAEKHLITYDEYLEGEGTPPAKNTNLVKIDATSVHITKKGAVSTQMYFENGKKHFGIYQTPFGSFDMMLETSELSVNETEELITVTINYALYLNKGKVSDCTIKMRIAAAPRI